MSTTKPLIGILLGSTRPGRNGEQVAQWVLEQASTRQDADFELIDLADHPLPFLDEPVPPSMHRYTQQHTEDWSATISRFDGFILVTPEYNHSIPAVLKNALDYLFTEWNNKAVGFVSYGGNGGVRAVEQLRPMAGELMMADVRAAVALNFSTEFEGFRTFRPHDYVVAALTTTLDQVIAWTNALAPLRAARPSAA